MTSQKLKWFALILVLGAAWFLLSNKIPLYPPLEKGESRGALESETLQTSVVDLTIDFGDGNVQNFSDIPLVTGATAFSILKNATETAKVLLAYDPSTGAGAFVRQIGEKKNGEGGRYWQYWVNEKFAMVAADKYELSAGDRVEWRFVGEIQ